MPTATERVFREYLRPYQRDWIEDHSQRKICLKSRRIGMSEALILEAFLRAQAQPYHDVYLCSTSFTNAKELLRRLGIWVEAFERAGKSLGIAEHKKTEIVFENGSRIIPMPALKVRSRTGTVILDELAFYQWDREVWKAVAPVADTSPDMRVIVVSTPFGASGVFWEIWNDPDDQYGDWSRHKIDVYEAADQGFPVEPDELRENYPSDIWKQEFCCQFLSDINQYFGYDLIRRSQYSPVDLEEVDLAGGDRYAGIDVASTQDATVLADAVQRTGEFWVDKMREIKAAGDSRDYTPQFEDIAEHLKARDFVGVGVDATGEGAQLAQDLRRSFGSPITGVRSSAWKHVRARIPDVRLAMERGELHLPNDPKVRHAFAAIERRETTTNQVKFEAERDEHGHADQFFATLLAWHVAHTQGGDSASNSYASSHQQAPI